MPGQMSSDKRKSIRLTRWIPSKLLLETITFTDFRKKTSGFTTEVEHGETLVLLRHFNTRDRFRFHPKGRAGGFHLLRY